MALDFGEAVQVAALQAVLRNKQSKPNSVDSEYSLRRVFRWYSKTFFTPLHEVEDLPLSDVLQSYWEERFEDMEDAELDDEKVRLLEDAEALRLRQIEEDADDADLWQMAREDTKVTSVTKTLEKTVQQPNDRSIARRHKDKEQELVPGSSRVQEERLPDIKMQFVPEGELDLETDGFGFGLLDRPKQS